jgi:putative two-component system response regulator
MPEDLLTAITNRAPAAHSVKQFGLTSTPASLGRQTHRDILLVDASRDTRRELRCLLEPLEHNIYEARTGKEALRMLSAQPVDLVLVDISTPDVNGFGFCKALRSYFRTRSLSVILIAEPEEAHQEASAIAAGADDFLVRPLVSEPLRARVQAILRRTAAAGSDDDSASVLVALAQAVEARDPGTSRHCQRVSLLCSTLGVSLGLRPEELVALQRGAYLHDIGKIAVPDSILLKRGPLSADEWTVMQNHTTCGERICSGMKSLSSVLPIIRSHHERWDGSGYPDRLRGDEIPLLARVIQVADIYDALTTDRPYKTAFSPECALQTLQNEVNAGWRDSRIIEAFADIFPVVKNVEAHSNTSLLALSLALGETARPAGKPDARGVDTIEWNSAARVTSPPVR